MTTNRPGGWIDNHKWGDRWQIEENLTGGAQGIAFKARGKGGNQVAFLKVLRNQTDSERRARFFREASAYDAFRVSGMPIFIESNAHKHGDDSYKLYIVTQFVEGPTLRDWRSTQTDVDLFTAILITRALLETVRKCHSAGCVHRDIKPDNVILLKGVTANPILLDFGLSYHDLPNIDFGTEPNQEVGNRFLRLPELSAGSLLKQDPRSDLSFIGGILFYLLTNQNPDILLDAEGRLPHQRGAVPNTLRAAAGLRFSRLATIFDKAFAPHLTDRYATAEIMQLDIARMVDEVPSEQTAEDDLAAIIDAVNTAVERRKAETSKQIGNALSHVQSVFDELSSSFGGVLELQQTGWHISGNHGRNTLIWCRAGNGERLSEIKYEAKQVGEEIVILIVGETIFRTSSSEPIYADDFKQAVKKEVLSRVRAALGG